MMIVWDEPKRLANIATHGLDFSDLELAFFEDAVIRPSHSGRLLAFGRNGGEPIAVVFKPLGREAVSVISMRRANRKERSLIDG
jgi:uncharacterized DUF497 family protein